MIKNYAMLLYKGNKRILNSIIPAGLVARDSTFKHFAAKFLIMIPAVRWFSVQRLPGVSHFMYNNCKDFPQWLAKMHPAKILF